MKNSIEVVNLSKSYNSKDAVRNINFKIKENEIIETVVKDLLKAKRNLKLSPTEITKMVMDDYTCEDFI